MASYRHPVLRLPELARCILQECDVQITSSLTSWFWMLNSRSYGANLAEWFCFWGEFMHSPLNHRRQCRRLEPLPRIRRLLLTDTIVLPFIHNVISTSSSNGPLFHAGSSRPSQHLLANPPTSPHRPSELICPKRRLSGRFRGATPLLMPRLKLLKLRISPPISPCLRAAFAKVIHAPSGSLEHLFFPPASRSDDLQMKSVTFHHPNLKTVLSFAVELYNTIIYHIHVLPALPLASTPFRFSLATRLGLGLPYLSHDAIFRATFLPRGTWSAVRFKATH
ncbi:hypothetical protein E1B28_002196 [Marasmius oreades]|uniref:Uncharacterized protein n=1 Tax=Marasmius oreades TaxID=181124 RepID=A0A9P7RN52_9AGAR|nr:uncharacterized protein E1B28_002196 [Marasmius oreades]KAG7086226.1 hypothetical protein E1B28_002196 [Marasmius oreades]